MAETIATSSSSDPLFTEISKPARSADPEHGFADHFLSVISQWAAAIPIQSFWVVYFVMPSLTPYLEQLISKGYDVTRWEGFSLKTFAHLVENYTAASSAQGQEEYTYGCAFARSISIPGEKIEMASTGFTHGGLLFPSVGKARQQTNNISVSFMETNSSFVDAVLRPWSIITSYLGFVPRTPSITGSMHAVFYTKSDKLDNTLSGPGLPVSKTPALLGLPLQKRKQFDFFNIAPIVIGNQEYTQQGDGLLVRPVDFYFTHYSLLNNSTDNLIR